MHVFKSVVKPLDIDSKPSNMYKTEKRITIVKYDILAIPSQSKIQKKYTEIHHGNSQFI